MIDRRPIIQRYLPPGWKIIIPTPNNPGYIDNECIFQDEHREARALLQITWFDDTGGYVKIEREIKRAINAAVVRG